MTSASDFENGVGRASSAAHTARETKASSLRSELGPAFFHVLCAGWVGLALGGLDACWVADRSGPTLRFIRSLIAGAGAGATLGVLLGVPIGLVGALLSLLETSARRFRPVRALG